MPTQVLLIDPDISFIINLKQALEGTGDFAVTVSGSGEATIELVRERNFDVAVIAFNLPDMDVMQCIAQLHYVQPRTPVILAPSSAQEQDRARFINAQGILPKPFKARDLIPYMRSVLTRTQNLQQPGTETDDFVPPEMPAALRHLLPEQDDAPPAPEEDFDREAVLDEFEAFDHSPSDALDWEEHDDTSSLGGTSLIDDEDEQSPARTRALDDMDEDEPTTTRLWDTETPEETSKLSKTESLDDMLDRQGWVEKADDDYDDYDDPVRTRALDPYDEAAPQDFDEVLDAVAQSPPEDRERSPDDRAFHDLVDSMRVPDESHPSLDDLLESIAQDVARERGEEDDYDQASSVFDYVLNAIRQGVSLTPSADDSGESELDDTTIGDVVEELFDPTFQDVLAAMAGEEIDDEPYEEPTYSGAEREGTGQPPAKAEAIPEDMEADEDAPAWLQAYEAEGIEPPDSVPEEWTDAGPPIDEPPVHEEDSSKYPATTALNAVSAPDDEFDFSLDDLLRQIEDRLPEAHPQRPDLKPLPSWQREADAPPTDTHEAEQLEALFDHLERTPPPPDDIPLPEEIAPPPASIDDPDTTGYDTPVLPPRAEEDAIDEAARPVDWDEDVPGADEFAAMFEPEIEEFGPPDEETTRRANIAYAAAEQELAGDRAEEQREAIAPPAEDHPAGEEAEDFDETLDTIIEDTYAQVQHAEDTADEAEAGDEDDAAALAVDWEEDAATPAADEDDDFVLDEDELIAVPVETAARMLGGDVDDKADEPDDDRDDDSALAQIAVQLTQFSLESSAQATLLSYPGELLAEAGDLPEAAMTRLFQIVDKAWQSGPSHSDALIRFVNLPEAGEFLLYSKLVDEGMILSMAFNASMPVRTIRLQARRLSESLDLVPEDQAQAIMPGDPAAAQTLPSRPTDLRPPEGLRKETAAPADEQPAPPPPADEPYTAYTCLWIPADPALELSGDLADALAAWLQEIAGDNEWDIDDLVIDADYVQLTLNMPHNTLPAEVITHLMDETAALSAEYFADQLGDGPLWIDGYYVVAPPRDLSAREISRFVTFQREA